MLVPSSMASRWCSHVSHVYTDQESRGTVSQDSKGQDTSLYSLAMQQLPFDADDEVIF